MFLNNDSIYPYTWQAIDDNQMSRHFTDAQYDLFGNVPCGVDIPLTPKLEDTNCAVLSNSTTKCPKSLEVNQTSNICLVILITTNRPYWLAQKLLRQLLMHLWKGTFCLSDYGSDCNSEITEASYSLHQFEEADEQCHEHETFTQFQPTRCQKT